VRTHLGLGSYTRSGFWFLFSSPRFSASTYSKGLHLVVRDFSPGPRACLPREGSVFVGKSVFSAPDLSQWATLSALALSRQAVEFLFPA
jgi:hypothetical protein